MPCIAGSGGSESGTTGGQSVAFPMWGILHCSEMSAGSKPKFLIIRFSDLHPPTPCPAVKSQQCDEVSATGM